MSVIGSENMVDIRGLFPLASDSTNVKYFKKCMVTCELSRCQKNVIESCWNMMPNVS